MISLKDGICCCHEKQHSYFRFFINPEDMFLDYSTIPEGCDCLYMYNEIYSDLLLTIFCPLWGKFYKISNKEWRLGSLKI